MPDRSQGGRVVPFPSDEGGPRHYVRDMLIEHVARKAALVDKVNPCQAGYDINSGRRLCAEAYLDPATYAVLGKIDIPVRLARDERPAKFLHGGLRTGNRRPFQQAVHLLERYAQDLGGLIYCAVHVARGVAARIAKKVDYAVQLGGDCLRGLGDVVAHVAPTF